MGAAASVRGDAAGAEGNVTAGATAASAAAGATDAASAAAATAAVVAKNAVAAGAAAAASAGSGAGAGAAVPEDLAKSVQEAAAAVPKPEGASFKYGTAGFRGLADNLDSTFLRVGMLAAVRGKQQGGKVCGVPWRRQGAVFAASTNVHVPCMLCPARSLAS